MTHTPPFTPLIRLISPLGRFGLKGFTESHLRALVAAVNSAREDYINPNIKPNLRLVTFGQLVGVFPEAYTYPEDVRPEAADFVVNFIAHLHHNCPNVRLSIYLYQYL